MSLLSSLFGRPGDDEYEDEYEEEEDSGEEKKQRSPADPLLTRKMPLVVTMADSGKFLLSGLLTEPSMTLMTIERAPGQLAFDTCPIGAKVHIQGYAGTVPVDLMGIVALSNRIAFKVKDLAVIPHDENRSNFRVPLSIPVSLYYQDDKSLQNPENCRLVNISTGGACVESEFIHTEGEVLRLKVHIGDYTPMTFLGQIIRVDEPKPGVFRYGFLFAQLNEQETSMLTRVLFNVQRGDLSAHHRRGYGHW